MNPINPIPGRSVQVDPDKADQLIGDFAEHCGLSRRETYSVDQAAELAQRLGYECTPATVLEFVRKRYLADPGETWQPAHVYALLAGLECRRRWQQTPCPHDLKKSGARLEIERVRAAGFDPPIQDLDATTIEDLLLQLVQTEDRATREVLYEALRLKLDGFEE